MTNRQRQVAASAMGLTACSGGGSTLLTQGEPAGRIAPLGWTLLIVASLVVLVVSLLLLLAILRHREDPARLERSGSGLRWILVGGVVVPTVMLIAVFILTLTTLSATATPADPPAVRVEVTGHRWWWEIRYTGARPDQIALTANELHLPVGKTVALELASSDVIHSFWVPELAGKTDLVPGQTNRMWIRVDAPGTYYGRCAEYCGAQHAHMQLVVVAEPPEAFAGWLERQRQSAPDPGGSAAREGQRVFLSSACALCHTVRGTGAGGRMGPDLTHLGGRSTIAAGTLQNTSGNLAAWIANSQGIKPGNLMPPMPLEPNDLRAVVAYLESLH